MSGLEIAGIVLGSIPLVISTLEHYRDGTSTLQRWRRYERELRSIIRQLEVEQARLENVCEKLLIDIVPHSSIEDMINDPQGPLWREKETQERVRLRLWACFEVFEKTMEDVREAVERISKRIAKQNEGKISEYKRAVFAFSRSSYVEQLTTIRDGISNLENLTDRNIELEPVRKGRLQGRFMSALRDISKSLYRAMRSGIQCTCKHDVSLGLEIRNTRMISSKEVDQIVEGIAFKLALSYEAPRTSPGLAVPQWEEILVELATIAQNQPSARMTTTQLPPFRSRLSQLKKSKKSVSFAGIQLTGSSSTTLLQTEIELDLPQAMSELTMQLASFGLSSPELSINLCEKLYRSPDQTCGEWRGIIIDNSSRFRKYKVCPVSAVGSHDRCSSSVTSLKSVLGQGCEANLLSYRDRLRLAVVISSSVLQLHGTPWLARRLTSDDVFFFKKDNSPDYDHPFVIKSLSESIDTSTDTGKCGSFRRNPILLYLGILLIELGLGKTFESLRWGQTVLSQQHSQIISDFIAADSIMGKTRMHSSYYSTAVARCIDGPLHDSDVNFDDKDYCQEVYAGVVALLEKDLENS